MKKKDFVTLIMSTVGGILFALGMCMALLPEWGAMTQGIAIGVVGAIVLGVCMCMTMVWCCTYMVIESKEVQRCEWLMLRIRPEFPRSPQRTVRSICWRQFVPREKRQLQEALIKWAIFLPIPAFSGGRDFRRKKVSTFLWRSHQKETIGQLPGGNKCAVIGA